MSWEEAGPNNFPSHIHCRCPWFVPACWAGALDLAVAVPSTSLINFGVGGEVGPAYAALAEFAPPRRRGAALMLATSFWNIGAAAIAALALQYADLAADRRVLHLPHRGGPSRLGPRLQAPRPRVTPLAGGPGQRGQRQGASGEIRRGPSAEGGREGVAERLLVTRRHIRRRLHRPAPHIPHSRLLPPLRTWLCLRRRAGPP